MIFPTIMTSTTDIIARAISEYAGIPAEDLTAEAQAVERALDETGLVVVPKMSNADLDTLVEAETRRCAGAICPMCKDGWPNVDTNEFHTSPDQHGIYDCKAAAMFVFDVLEDPPAGRPEKERA